MQDGHEGSTKPPDNEEPPQPSSSYIYPVKSLLTGIQPAPPTQSMSSIPRPNSSQTGDIVALQDLLAHQLTDTRKKSPTRPHSMLYPYPSRTAIAGPSDVSEEHSRKASDPFSPRMEPIDGQSSLSISFTEAAFPPTATQPSVSRSSGPLAPPELDLSVPSDPPPDISPAPPHSAGDKVLTSFESKPPSDSVANHLMNEGGRASPAHSVDSHVSHISQSGIVHLPGLSSASGSSRAGSRGSGSHTHNSSRNYFPSTNSGTSSQRMHQVPEAQEEEDGTGGVSSHSSSDPKSAGPKAEGDFFTAKYRYDTDENENHVVIGQEGDIRRCEDEVRVS